METWILKLIETSPVLGAFIAFWYFQRKDYTGLVSKTQDENAKREIKYQETISKNQEIITENQNIIGKLTSKLDVVDTIQNDVEDIKEYMRK